MSGEGQVFKTAELAIEQAHGDALSNKVRKYKAIAIERESKLIVINLKIRFVDRNDPVTMLALPIRLK